MSRIDHDALWKMLIRLHLFELIELFAPRLYRRLDRSRVEFLNVELPGLRRRGRRADLVAKVYFRHGGTAFIIIHVEFQSSADPALPRRMFLYYARLDELHLGAPIYPLALLDFDLPRRRQPRTYRRRVVGEEILKFQFRTVQFNRLRWRRYLRSRNPLAIALMARMGVKPRERARVKLECLRRLGLLQWPDEKVEVLWSFVDTYLSLEGPQEAEFQASLARLPDEQKEKIMRLPNSWIDKGRAEGRVEGRVEGRAEGRADVVLHLLAQRFGEVPAGIRKQLKSLPGDLLVDFAKALLEFRSLADAREWLRGHMAMSS
jgi:hypothetical protein